MRVLRWLSFLMLVSVCAAPAAWAGGTITIASGDRLVKYQADAGDRVDRVVLAFKPASTTQDSHWFGLLAGSAGKITNGASSGSSYYCVQNDDYRYQCRSPTGSIDTFVVALGGGDDSLAPDAGQDTYGAQPQPSAEQSMRIDLGPGKDVLKPFLGDETIEAADGEVDEVACGKGDDTVHADSIDQVAADCEHVTRVYRDQDGDGSAEDVDCDDKDAARHPGATDTPGDGIDQDCSGADATPPPPPPAPVPVDADGDGATTAIDCNDNDPKVRPGLTDTPGDGIDQDCSGADAVAPPAPEPDASLKVKASAGRTTTVKRLTLTAPEGAKVVVTCKGPGCPAGKKRLEVDDDGILALGQLFTRPLKPGAVVTIKITGEDGDTQTLVLTVRRGKPPKVREVG